MSMTHKEALKEAVKKWLCEDDVDGFVTEAIDSGSVSWVLDAESAICAYIEARGLVLVPKVPTEKMFEAVDCGGEKKDWCSGRMHASSYVRMIAAAPDPFVTDTGEVRADIAKERDDG